MNLVLITYTLSSRTPRVIIRPDASTRRCKYGLPTRRHGTVHHALVYPKPFNLMARLVSAHEKVISATPCDAKVVLVGVGMGARVAVHLMSGNAGR